MRRIAVFASLLVAMTAQAGEWQSGAKPGPHSADVNKDGIVTRDEAKAYPRLAGDFDAADANKDGQLDTAEMNAHRERMRVEMRAQAEERWKAADKDGDGSVSRAEAEVSMPRIAERFEKFDANGDGRISRDEMHGFRMKKKKTSD